ncbi:MAG: Bax inhibitor-1/YccA family protein [Gemmatimonadota bacterium]|nr:Bax inhibitor-1/YccA family protein [Gemmatimonadota bacterium]
MGFSRYQVGAMPRVLSGVERASLVRRTYGLVFLGIVAMLFGAAFTATQASLISAVAAHPIITFFVTMVPLWMAQTQARSFPRNIILTLLYTFLTGVWLAPMLVVYARMDPGALGQAGMLTFAAFGGLTLYATFSRRDFSAWGGFFFVGLVVLLITGLALAFFPSAAALTWYSAAGVLVFSGLLVFDTWRITRSGQFGDQDYVIAAVTIFVDLLNLFLFILSLVGGGDRRR